MSLGLTNETFVEKQTDSDNKSHNKQITGEGPDEGHNAKGTYKAAKNKMEARKQLRAERAQLWKELLESKPDENYEDPRDIAAIRFAETHLGDYKLKTGERYIVPESERVDADKKRRQLVLLNQSIFNLKENFNKQVIALRDNKQYLLRKFEEYLRNIEDINKELYEMGETIETFNGPPKMDVSL